MKKPISILITSISFFTFSCSPISSSSQSIVRIKNHDYDEIITAKINYFDVFNQNEDEYFLYYFSETCYHCVGIKNEIIDFALSSEVTVYFVEVEERFGVYDDVNKTVGTSNPLEAFANQTPQLSLVKDKEIYYSICGEDVELFLFTK